MTIGTERDQEEEQAWESVDDYHYDSLDDIPTLRAVSNFAKLLKTASWFSVIGMPLSEDERSEALDYLNALGFPDAGIGEITDWEDAEEAARNPDWNTGWWEAEEQLRAALVHQAIELIGDEETLLVALTHVTSTASDVVHGAAAVAASRFGLADEGLIRAAAGAATQSAYQAALVLAAGEDESHAFSAKFRLFEGGRWPLGVVGNTLNVF